MPFILESLIDTAVYEGGGVFFVYNSSCTTEMAAALTEIVIGSKSAVCERHNNYTTINNNNNIIYHGITLRLYCIIKVVYMRTLMKRRTSGHAFSALMGVVYLPLLGRGGGACSSRTHIMHLMWYRCYSTTNCSCTGHDPFS